MQRDERISVSVVFDPALLAEIDAAAKEQDLNRSQYLRLCARKEIRATRPLVPTLTEKAEVPA